MHPYNLYVHDIELKWMCKSFCSSSPEKEQGPHRKLFDGLGPR